MMLELSSQPDSKNEASAVVATKSLKLKRMEARDRRLAAIHEAAHHTIARHRGVREIDSWIERVGDPTRHQTSWVGHCRWRTPSRCSKVTQFMIGVAGMIAENLWKAGNDPNQWSICDLLDDPNCMSESDWRISGLNREDPVLTNTQLRATETVTNLLLGPLRHELLRQARTLIIESRDLSPVQSPIVAPD